VTQQTHNTEDRQLNMLCSVEALRILAMPATEHDEAVRNFAKEACSNSFTPPRILMSETELEKLMRDAEANVDPDATKSVAEVFSDIVALAEGAEARFVADFCSKMFAAAFFERSNAKKVTFYHILQAAVEGVALFEDDYSPAEKLAKLVARAEFFLFDKPNDARFKDAIVHAFEVSKYGNFTRLAEEIRKATAGEDLRRLAFRLIGPQKVVLDAGAKRLMKVRVPPKRTRGTPPVKSH
jgi:hypothetical protein